MRREQLKVGSFYLARAGKKTIVVRLDSIGPEKAPKSKGHAGYNTGKTIFDVVVVFRDGKPVKKGEQFTFYTAAKFIEETDKVGNPILTDADGFQYTREAEDDHRPDPTPASSPPTRNTTSSKAGAPSALKVKEMFEATDRAQELKSLNRDAPNVGKPTTTATVPTSDCTSAPTKGLVSHLSRVQASSVDSSSRPSTSSGPSFDGLHCPLCGSKVKKSNSTGRMYCPKQYAEPAPCKWPGTRDLPEIPLLTTMSEEQLAIAELSLDLSNNIMEVARAGTGKSTMLQQQTRVWTHPPTPRPIGWQPKTVLILAFAKRDEVAMSAKVMNRADVKTSNAAGYGILNHYFRSAGGKADWLNVDEELPSQVLESKLREDGLLPPTGKRVGQQCDTCNGNGMVPGDGETTGVLAECPDCIQGRYTRKIGRDTEYVVTVAVDKARSVLPLTAAGTDGTNTEPTPAQWDTLCDQFDLEYEPEERVHFLYYANWLFREMADLGNLLGWGKTDFTGQTFLPVYHRLAPPKRWQVVCIDEVQDQSWYNQELARMLVTKGGHLVAVGDEFQTIYEWRIGTEDLIQRMMRTMADLAGKEPDAMPLTLCRRCSQSVIQEAQRLVPDIRALPEAPEGEVFHEPDGSRLLERLKAERRGLVLCRVNAPLFELCLALWTAGVKAGLSKGSVGPETAKLIDKVSGGDDAMPLKEFLAILGQWETDQLRKLGAQAEPDLGASSSSQTEEGSKKARRGKEVPQREEPPTPEEAKKQRKASIVSNKAACLRALAGREDAKTAGCLKRILAELQPKKGEVLHPDTAVVLSTVHGAKGSEARSVYIYSPPSKGKSKPVSVFDQIWSSPRDRDNVLYVAITRAELSLGYYGPKPTLERFSDRYQEDYE